jgi:hypothetical protein
MMSKQRSNKKKSVTRNSQAPTALVPRGLNANNYGSIKTNNYGAITRKTIGQVHKYVRVTPLTMQNFVPNSHLGFGVHLDELSEIADLSNLYDEYRIDSVTWRLSPVITTVDATETLGDIVDSDPGMLEFVVDYDDSDTPTSAAVLQQYESYRVVPFRTKRIESTITPAIACPAFETLTTTAYRPKWGQWIDLRYPDVPHYGWKYWFNSMSTDPLKKYPYYQQFTFNLSFRRVR